MKRGERVSVSSEFGRRAADDELCAAVRQAVEEGDADALRRLGLDGWGDYVQRLSELMNESVRDELDYSPDFGALMSQVASPARYAHHLVTESGTAIQKAKDAPLGIHIKPLEPEFDDDALKGTVGTAANMDDPAQAVETLADGLAYAVKKAGNEFVEKNAEQRSRAGFEVGVKRSGSSKCCEWCAARIGSWALKNAPDGVFGCHANCSCTVEYTSSTGAKTSASGANLNRLGVGAFTEIEYQPPHVMTHEEAREKGGFDEPKRLTKNPVESQPHRLTGAANGGIIEVGGKYVVGTKQWFKQQDLRAKQATSAYQDIFNADNIKAIADSSGLSEEDVQIIKNHVFANKHIMYDGTLDRFTPDYDMAVAFKRLEQGKPEKRDILLLKHELYESQCEEKYHLTASEAHAMATQKYDWQSVIESLNDGDGELDDLL